MKVFVFGSADFGGHEVMAIKILRVVLQAKIPVICFINASNSRLSDELSKLDVKVKCFEFGNSKLDLIFGSMNPLIASIRRLMQQEFKEVAAKHVIMINGNAVANHRATIGIMQACKALSVRSTVYVPMIHTADELALSPFKSWFYTRAAKRGLTLSSDVLVISETWKKRADSLRPDNPAVVVHNLVNSPAQSDRPINQPGSSAKRFCFIGRYDRKQKGLDFLFNAIALMSQKNTVALDMVGDGPDRQFVDVLIAELPTDVAARIRQHGWQADPLRILRECDALLMPSRVEGAPLVALEALSLGIPVFAFDVPGVNDIVPHRLLSPAFDVEHFANSILAKDDQMQQQVAAHADVIKKYFDPARFAAEVHAAFAIE